MDLKEVGEKFKTIDTSGFDWWEVGKVYPVGHHGGVVYAKLLSSALDYDRRTLEWIEVQGYKP